MLWVDLISTLEYFGRQLVQQINIHTDINNSSTAGHRPYNSYKFMLYTRGVELAGLYSKHEQC